MEAEVHSQQQHDNGLVLPPVVRSEQIKFVDHAKFHETGAWDALVESPYPERGPHHPNTKIVLPSKAQDEYLFLKMNYLKSCASQVQRQYGAGVPPMAERSMRLLQERAAVVEGKILNEYEPMVKYCVAFYVNSFVSWEDLMNRGRLGLHYAIEHFNVALSEGFKKYAFIGIQKELLRVANTNRVKREAAFAATRVPCHLSELSSIPDPKSPFSFIEALDRADAIEKVEQAIETLPPRERFVLTLHYGLNGNPPQALEDVARMLPGVKRHNKGGASRQYAHQIEVRALEKLRKRLLKYQGVW